MSTLEEGRAIQAQPHNVLILGIGNVLLTDEGTGVHAARRLLQLFPAHSGVTILDGGTLSFTLLADIQECDCLIAVDAAELHAPPGTVRCFVNEEMDLHLRSGRKSVHEVSLADLLDMARLAGKLPARRALIAVQPAELGWGDQLSPQVATAIPKVELRVQRLLDHWDVPALPGTDPQPDPHHVTV